MKTSQTFVKRIFTSLQLTLITFLLTVAIQAAGEIDPTFNAAVQQTTLGSVETIVVQPDGKLLVGGNFTVAGNTARSNVARLNADGTVDPTFEPPDFYKQLNQFNPPSLTNVLIRAIAVQTDGKVLVGGDFSGVNNQPARGVVRLNADGSLDTSFNVAFFSNTTVIYDIKIQAENQILVGGIFNLNQGGIGRNGLARLNLDGSIDTSFAQPIVSGAVLSFAIQADGKIVYANTNSGSGNGVVRRANSNGSADNSFPDAFFAGNGTIGAVTLNKVVIQPDGKILVGGLFLTVNSFPQNNITRLNTDGSLDTTFNINGAGAGQRVNGIAVLPDGKIVIGGLFDTYNSVQRRRNARLNADGTLDTTFNYNPGTGVILNEIKSLGDGRVIIGGSDSTGNFDKLARLNTDGSLDATFTGAVYQRGNVLKLLTQPDGKILVAGAFLKINGVFRQNFARLNQDGSVDAGFVANATGGVTSISLQSDGKIVIGGSFFNVNGVNRFGLARLNIDGSVDTSFTSQLFSPPYIDEVVVLADGKIIVAGNLGLINNVNVNVVRLTSTGTIDSTFVSTVAGVGGVTNSLTIIRSLKVQPDGKIIIVGEFTGVNGTNRGRIARLNANGVLDNTFNPPFGANASINDLAIQSNGSIVIGGEFLAVNGSAVGTRPYLARFLSDGTLDTSFSAAANNYVYVVERQADDKILIGGTFSQINGVSRYGIARLNADGTYDNSFVGTGTNDIVRTITVQSDSKILIGGEFTRLNGTSRVSIARLQNAPGAARTPYDYDGDGKADLSVFRPSNGVWYQLNSTSNQQTGQQFGQSGDVIAPGDFDGDGRTDLAVYRLGIWYIQRSSLGFTAVAFGATDDLPVPADYDADGKSDVAVFRPSNGTWYRVNSSNGQIVTIAFGQLGDKPTLGDFDGNGTADIAVFRPSNGVWYRINAQGQQVGQQFGQAGDLIVPADYDGDGKTDLAIYRPSVGTWYLQRSLLGFTGVAFGDANDKPVPADYDGDGKADIAVYRPSNGVWYLLRTTQGFTGTAFGITEDAPVPNAFVR